MESDVLYCKQDHDPVAKVAKAPVACEECNKEMTKIGWMENNAPEAREEETNHAGD